MDNGSLGISPRGVSSVGLCLGYWDCPKVISYLRREWKLEYLSFMGYPLPEVEMEAWGWNGSLGISPYVGSPNRDDSIFNNRRINQGRWEHTITDRTNLASLISIPEGGGSLGISPSGISSVGLFLGCWDCPKVIAYLGERIEWGMEA